MDAIEQAIRNALEKGDAENRAFREKVYRQAFSALERALQANPALTVEAAIRRRRGLQEKITEIEAEFLPALPPLPGTAAPARPAPRPDVPAAAPPVAAAPYVPTVQPEPPQAGQRMEPSFSEAAPASAEPIPVAPDIRVESTGPTPVVPDIMAETAPEQAPIPEPSLSAEAVAAKDRASARRERKRPFAAAFLGITLLCLAAIGAWWVVQSGMLGDKSIDLTGIEKPAAESEDFEPGAEGAPALPGQADPARQWITIFEPGDPSTVTTPGDATAEVVEDQGQKVMRIKSGTGGSAVLFDVGQGVLEQIAGKKATFDVVARAQDGQQTEISIACNFGELGDCGRTRYAVGATKADYLLEIAMPTTTPGAGGTIAINSDFSNGGKSVDIYEVKVSVAP